MCPITGQWVCVQWLQWMDPSLVDSVKNRPTSKTLFKSTPWCCLELFGLCSYYQSFIKHFATITKQCMNSWKAVIVLVIFRLRTSLWNFVNRIVFQANSCFSSFWKDSGHRHKEYGSKFRQYCLWSKMVKKILCSPILARLSPRKLLCNKKGVAGKGTRTLSNTYIEEIF